MRATSEAPAGGRAAVILAAAALDAIRGEPRRTHPVHAMGAYLRKVRNHRPGAPLADRALGFVAVAAGCGAAYALARSLERTLRRRARDAAQGCVVPAPRPCTAPAARWLPTATDRRLPARPVRRLSARTARRLPVRAVRRLPAPAAVLTQAVLLKPAFAIRALLEAGAAVVDALDAGDLDRARTALARHLVSRPTRELTAPEVAGAAIESLAENLTDSVVAPLLAAAIGGAGAAYAYRFLNVADAVLGYRTPELIDLGRAAARLDDAANLLPARLAAVLIAAAAPVAGASPRDAWTAARRDRRATASPNAGWTMAAMAGALGVRLTKRDAYVLNGSGGDPTVADLRRALRIVATASGMAVLGAATAAGVPERGA